MSRRRDVTSPMKHKPNHREKEKGGEPEGVSDSCKTRERHGAEPSERRCVQDESAVSLEMRGRAILSSADTTSLGESFWLAWTLDKL